MWGKINRDSEKLRPGEGGHSVPESRPRVLYWWPSPVSPENSLRVGQRMLTACLVWFISLFVLMILLGALFPATG